MYSVKSIKVLERWMVSKDCYGVRMVNDWEWPKIVQRFYDIKDTIIIFEGDLEINAPNEVLIDITHLKPNSNKKIIISLSHYLRPCPCNCHDWQYQCYLNDCQCCSGSCT